MSWRVFIGGVCSIAFNYCFADIKLHFDAPKFLVGPTVSSSLLGTTFTYRTPDSHDPTTLQITVVSLPKAALIAGEFSADHCVQLFLTEVARDHPGFFAVPMERALDAGTLRLHQVRWTYKDRPTRMTGVTSCGLNMGRYISINFQGSLTRATHTFPAIRQSLKSIRIDK